MLYLNMYKDNILTIDSETQTYIIKLSITIGRSVDTLWNNLRYTSAISLKQYISKDKKQKCEL